MPMDEDAIRQMMAAKKSKEAEKQAARMPVVEDAERLVPLNYPEDLPREWANSPCGDLVKYHNFHQEDDRDYTGRANLVIWRLFEFRPKWNLPAGFAFDLTTAGPDYRGEYFPLLYAAATHEVRAIAVVAHSNSSLHFMEGRGSHIITQLSNMGMTDSAARKWFEGHAVQQRVESPIMWALAEAARVRDRLPSATVVPMLYAIEGDRLFGLKDK